MSRPGPTSSHQPMGFTLVELLVVLAIVGMLMALLMPALSKARSTANRISCGTTQRQLGIALINYTIDFKDRLPVPSEYGVNHNITIYRGNTSAVVRKHAEGATGLGLLWWKQYATNPEIFYCTEFRSNGDSADGMRHYTSRQVSVARFLANYGKSSGNANHDLSASYVLSRSANVHPGGSPSGNAAFQDTDGLVTNARPQPRYHTSNPWIGGLLGNNLNPPVMDNGIVLRNQFYPIAFCMQMKAYGRLSHGGTYTNRLAGDGSVRPLSYDFANLGGTYTNDNWYKLTYINSVP